MKEERRLPRVTSETVARGLREGAALLDSLTASEPPKTPDVATDTTVAETEAPPTTRTVVSPPRTVTDPASISRDGFTSSIPWDSALADVVVICCSSEQFDAQNREFVAALGFKRPHFLQVPSGPAVFHGMIAVRGILAKGMELLLDKALDVVPVQNVICIAHARCGGYQSGKVAILGSLTRRLTGLDLKQVQLEHLRKAARELQHRLGRERTVRAFYADVINVGGEELVHFQPIALNTEA